MQGRDPWQHNADKSDNTLWNGGENAMQGFIQQWLDPRYADADRPYGYSGTFPRKDGLQRVQELTQPGYTGRRSDWRR